MSSSLPAVADCFYQPIADECEVFRRAFHARLPLLIKGPTGCGKTRFVAHMAAQLGVPLITVACHDDLSGADLVGRHLLAHDRTHWQDGPLSRAVREGAICYLDELTEARRDTTVVLHPLTDDRRILPIERTGELLQAPPHFMLVASYNPGYQSTLKALKPSTRQRFVALEFTYPTPVLEATIVQTEAGCSPALAQQLVALAGDLRRLSAHDLEEGASTRLLIHAARLQVAGLPLLTACQSALIDPLTDDHTTRAALMAVVMAHLPT
jgi:nitric oxide reductase NorQ protein